jgi:hypothetical protein
MIYRARTITLHPEQGTAYKAVALQASAYVNQHYPAIHVELLENIAGRQQQIHMITRCESLAALEVYETQRKTDAGWVALVEEASALQATLETVDHLYRVIS